MIYAQSSTIRAMTEREAAELIEELKTHGYWVSNRRLAFEVQQRLQDDADGTEWGGVVAGASPSDGTASVDAPLRQRYADALRVALGAVRRNDDRLNLNCLSRQVGDGDDGVDPIEVACKFAKDSLPAWVWSVTDELSPFGNDRGWDWLQRIAQARPAPVDLEAAVMTALAEEWQFDGELSATGKPDTREVDIAQALVAAAFASILLWGSVTAELRDVALRAANLLARTADDPRWEDMAAALSVARMAAG